MLHEITWTCVSSEKFSAIYNFSDYLDFSFFVYVLKQQTSHMFVCTNEIVGESSNLHPHSFDRFRKKEKSSIVPKLVQSVWLIALPKKEMKMFTYFFVCVNLSRCQGDVMTSLEAFSMWASCWSDHHQILPSESWNHQNEQQPHMRDSRRRRTRWTFQT